MKVTVCFDDIKIIVPCAVTHFTTNNNNNNTDNNQLIFKNGPKISDVIENAIFRYKKATNKVH